MNDEGKQHKLMESMNEDRIITTPPLFAVLDGHGGQQIGVNAEKLLRAKLGKKGWRRKNEGYENGLRRIFREIDRNLYKNVNRLSQDMTLGSDWHSGCTCTVAIISENGEQLICASIGDSQLFAFEYDENIGRHINTFRTPLDSANEDAEKRRIEKVGGKVYNTRVGGRLAMTRSFGDFDLEKSNNPFTNKPRSYPGASKMIVSPVPHVFNLPLSSKGNKEVWWILASDGLWDIAKIDNITQIMDEIKLKHSDKPWDERVTMLHDLLPYTNMINQIKTPPGREKYPHDDESIITFITNIEYQ